MITNLIFTSIASAVIIIKYCTKIESSQKQILAIAGLAIIIIAATFLEMYSSWISSERRISERRRKEQKDYEKDDNKEKFFRTMSRIQEVMHEYFEKEKIDDIKATINIENSDKPSKDWIFTSVIDYKDKDGNDKSKYVELGPVIDVETSINSLVEEIEMIRLSANV